MSEQQPVPVVPETKPDPAKPIDPSTIVEVPSMQKPDQMASKFAALAKKERQARMLHMQAKARGDELSKREAAIAEREKLWEDEFRTSPLVALKRRNITYEDLNNAVLNDGKFQPDVEIKSVRDELQRLRQDSQDKERKALEDAKLAQEQAEAQAVETFKGRIGEFITQNGEKYELTKLYDASELVFQTVEQHFERTKKVLSIDEACGLVEGYLEAELERTSKESKKFQSKFLASKETEDKSPPKSTTTLSNNLNSSSAPSMLPQKTEDDRIKRALAALG